MGKFRLRVKLQGFEVEFDGERADFPDTSALVQRQIAGLLTPVDAAGDGQKQLVEGNQALDAELTKGRARMSRRRGGNAKSADSATPIELRHDSAAYRNPLQSWSIDQKCIWLLYVLKNAASLNEVSGPQLAATFNHYFKTAGKIHPPLATREMTKVKGLNPAPLGEDKGLWFLTAEGERQAQDLIQSVPNPATA